MPRSTKKSAPLSQSYDELKEFEGRKYTGMKVGRGHKWQYAAGEWVEKKLTPDRWEFRYAVNKQRRGKAPAGSGVPVGTAYHWYILADQTVTKAGREHVFDGHVRRQAQARAQARRQGHVERQRESAAQAAD